MEVSILGNQYGPPQSSSSPITVPAYQADQAVIELAGNTSPITIGTGNTGSPITINSDYIDVFSISNAITTQIVLTYATIEIIILTVNGLEYYQTLDWTLGSDNKTISFNNYIPYSSVYGNTVVKVVYVQQALSNEVINAASISFDPTGTTIVATDVQDAIVYVYNHTVGGYVQSINGITPVGGAITLNPGDIGAQVALNGTGFIKATGTTITYDNSTYETTAALATTLANYPLTSTLGTGAYANISLYPLTSTLGTGAYATISNYALISSLGTNAFSSVSYEPALGNPSNNGYVLSSTTGGVRSWVAQGSASMVYPSAGIAVSTGSAWAA